MEIRGKIIQNLGLQKGKTLEGKDWTKAEVIIETEGQYPKKIKLSTMKNAERLASLAVGSSGLFFIDISSREYNGKYYTEVSCYKWNLDNTGVTN